MLVLVGGFVHHVLSRAGIVCAGTLKIMIDVFRQRHFQLLFRPACFQFGEKASYISIRTTQRVFHITLPVEPIRILRAKVILNNTIADNNIAQDDFGLLIILD